MPTCGNAADNHGAPAPAQHQPECPEKLRRRALGKRHTLSWSVISWKLSPDQPGRARKAPGTYHSRAVGRTENLTVTRPAPLERAFLIVIGLLGWLGIVLQLWVSAHLAMRNGHSAMAGHRAGVVLLNRAHQHPRHADRNAVRVARTRGFLLMSANAGRGGCLYFRRRASSMRCCCVRCGRPRGCTSSPMRFCTRSSRCSPQWWLLYAPKQGLRWSGPLGWLAYPLGLLRLLRHPRVLHGPLPLSFRRPRQPGPPGVG